MEPSENSNTSEEADHILALKIHQELSPYKLRKSSRNKERKEKKDKEEERREDEIKKGPKIQDEVLCSKVPNCELLTELPQEDVQPSTPKLEVTNSTVDSCINDKTQEKAGLLILRSVKYI